MTFKVNTTEEFENKVYYYIKKRYTKIKSDISFVVSRLEEGILLGDIIPGLNLENNESTYKARFKDSTFNIGTRGGFRLIYYLNKETSQIYLLTLYSKKDKENISSKEILELITYIKN